MPFAFFGYFVLKLLSELCIGSFPCPPDSCIMTALINSTYSPIPYCFAYFRMRGSYTCTSALIGLTVLELSPPVMERAAPKSNTTIKTNMAIHPPAAIAVSNAFVPAIIAFATETVVFATALTVFSVAFPAVFADFSAAFRDAFAALYAFFAACSVVFTVVLAVCSAVFTECPAVFTLPFPTDLTAFSARWVVLISLSLRSTVRTICAVFF